MYKTLISISLTVVSLTATAQSALYPQHFDLSEVQLLDSPFKTSMATNAELLLRYDADRLMTPFVREAKLNKAADAAGRYYKWVERHPSFTNWGQSGWSLEGHIGGHYLTALSLAWAATKADPSQADLTEKLKARLDYCLDILADCQAAYNDDTTGMKGFIGGQPCTQIWTGLYAGDLAPFRKYGGWVPFYCQHKVLAGLRDAYIYAGSEKAKTLFHGLADWSVNVVSHLTDKDFQAILGWEHGGMNETLADAYEIFGDQRYLDAAKRYSHKAMIDGMQTVNKSFLNSKHANTQVPKYIGFERIAQNDPTMKDYRLAALNFWQDVADNRTVCIGGNSVGEHFLTQTNCNQYIDNLDGPESCNTNNMLKLSEDLFDDSHNATYADFYENAMYNHILATQDPQTGGYVYFTTLRPQGYKIYSQVNQGMWCCVGTGMENHSKYGHFIYTHKSDTLFVNLFTASKLTNKHFAIEQQTTFPYKETTSLTVQKAGKYTIALRHPAWAEDGYKVVINGEKQSINIQKGKASYVTISRKWKKGDKIEVRLPMALRLEECPNLPEYVAIKYGPVLLAAATGNDDMGREYGDESRMGHSPAVRTQARPIISSPMLIDKRENVLARIRKTGDLSFTIDASNKDVKAQWGELPLKPFFATHHTRYVIYWYQQTAEQYAASPMAKAEAEREALERRTVDFVGTGEQQSEAGHQASYSDNSSKGNYKGEFYRDANAGGFVQYVLENKESATDSLNLILRFTTADKGRKCNIYIDGKLLQQYTVQETDAKGNKGFYNYEIAVPDDLLRDAKKAVKTQFTVKVQAPADAKMPGLYFLRLVKTSRAGL